MKKLLQWISLTLVLVTVLALFASCAPAADPADAVAALKDAGYTALVDKVAAPALYIQATGKTVTAAVIGEKLDEDGKNQIVTILYFESAADAKAAYDTEALRADVSATQGSATDWVYAKSGSMIYWGTKAAVKAAR